MKKNVLCQRIALEAIFTTLILWCGLCGLPQAMPDLSSVLSHNAITDADLDDQLGDQELAGYDKKKLQALIDKSLVMIDRIPAEKIHALCERYEHSLHKQDAFNNRLIAQMKVTPWRKVGLYNKDVMKLGCCAGDVAIDWVIYHRWIERSSLVIRNFVALNAPRLLSLHLGNEDVRVAEQEALYQSLVALLDKQSSSFVLLSAVVNMTSSVVQDGLALNTKSFSEIHNLIVGKKAISAFSLLEKQPFITLPISFLNGSWSDYLVHYCQHYGIVQHYWSAWYMLFSKRLIFHACFFRWHTRYVVRRTLKLLTNDYRSCLEEWSVLNQSSSNSETDRVASGAVLKALIDYVGRGSFTGWLEKKWMWYGIFNATFNCCVAFPLWVKCARWAYSLGLKHQAIDNNDSNSDVPIDLPNQSASVNH